MDTIFMNSKISKAIDPNKLLLNLSGKNIFKKKG